MLNPRTDHALGDAVGRYRLLGEIARGGMGIVYVAAAQGPAGFSKLVALKELRPDLVEDGEFLTMFLEEARVAARLNHPNIVQTNDVENCDGRHFIAMEYLDGRSFYHVLKRFRDRGGLPLRLAVSVLRDALAALDYAHELAGLDGKPLGFVHRDVSPHNIFVTFEGHTKVIDFGIAKARDSSLETKTGVLKGRANYMSPEQLVRRADRRSDIFSVGAILFEVLSGRRLWQGMGEIEILAGLTRGEIPQLPDALGDIPPALIDICRKSLMPRPDDRYNTAAEMRDALDQWLWSTGGAPRNRELSDALSLVFDAERQRTKSLVEGALFRLQSGAGGQLETLAIGDRDAGHDSSRRGQRSQPSAYTNGGASRIHRDSSVHSTVSPHSQVGRHSQVGHHSQVGRHSSIMHSPPVTGVREPTLAGLREMSQSEASQLLRGGPALGTSTLDALPHAPWPEAPRRTRMWVIAGALGTVFVATTALVAFERNPAPVPVQTLQTLAQQVPQAAQPQPQAVGAPAPAAAIQPRENNAPRLEDTITLSVGVTPSTAEIYIDGERMPSNPFIGRFAKTGESHKLRAVAPGYQPKDRVVSFADNVMVDLSLNALPHLAAPAPQPARHWSQPPLKAATRQPEPPRSSPAPAVAPAETAPAEREVTRSSRKSDIAPRGEGEPLRKRAIDTSNPYDDDR